MTTGEHASRSVLAISLMVGQAFFFNAVFFTYGLVVKTFFGVSDNNVPRHLLPFAIGSFFGPLLLGRLFDTWGRKPMITLTYGLAGGLLLATLIPFGAGSLGERGLGILFTCIFFVASSAASAAYLTVSEIFPLEVRALALAVFYSIGIGIGGVFAPLLFGVLINTHSRWASPAATLSVPPSCSPAPSPNGRSASKPPASPSSRSPNQFSPADRRTTCPLPVTGKEVPVPGAIRVIASSTMSVTQRSSGSRHRGLLALLLLFSLALSLHLSANKLFWQDELFKFYSDARSTMAAVLKGQRDWPFSLEPPAFHLLLHLMQRLPFRPEISTRLPSALGFLLTQFCAFQITLRLTRSQAAALLAAASPLCLISLEYSAEARVYSLLTGIYAIAFLCYTNTLAGKPKVRRVADLGLFLSFAAGILLHYYGLLLPLPFLLAECVRLFRQTDRRWSTLVAILSSFLFFTLNLPFLPALREIRAMYYDSGEARWDMAPLTYAWLALQLRIYHLRTTGGLKFDAVILLVLILLSGTLLLLFRRARRLPRQAAETSLLLALAAGLLLPIADLILGIYQAHAYTPRYSLPVVLPLVVIAATLLQPFLRKRLLSESLVLVVVLSGLVHGMRQAHLTYLDGQALRARLRLTPGLQRALATIGDPHIYFQDTAEYLPLFFYAPPALREHFMLVQSVALEYKWNHSAASGLFSRNMHASTSLPITTYEQLRLTRQPFLLVTYHSGANHSGADWLLEEMPATGVSSKLLGAAFDGTLLRVDPH